MHGIFENYWFTLVCSKNALSVLLILVPRNKETCTNGLIFSTFSPRTKIVKWTWHFFLISTWQRIITMTSSIALYHCFDSGKSIRNFTHCGFCIISKNVNTVKVSIHWQRADNFLILLWKFILLSSFWMKLGNSTSPCFKT